MRLKDLLSVNIRTILKSYWDRSKIIAKKYSLPALFFFFDRIWCRIRYGATSTEDYELFGFYRLRGFEKENFFTHGRYKKTLKWFFPKDMIEIVDARKGFANNFKEFLHRDVLFLPCTEKQLQDFADRYEKIFVKKDISMCGRGIHVYTKDQLTKNPDLIKIVSEMDGVAEEPIIQHEAMAQLNPEAVSTLRITTLVEKSGNIRILGIILRVGQKGSYLDNVAAGGYFYEVDITEGIVVGWGRNASAEKTLFSPTGAVVPGLRIPYWNQVIDMIMSAAKKYPKARMVGWDIAIGVNGPVLVEANSSTGPQTVQFGDHGCWNYLKSQRG